MPGTYSIKTDPMTMPVVHGPHRQPCCKDRGSWIVDRGQLKKMDKERHLANATNSTDWVNSMIVSSQGEKIRSRLEPGDLN